VVGGIILLRERPAASQLTGIALVVGGLLLLGGS
jgi:drug/metabolite transporter (DMT)-like permease